MIEIDTAGNAGWYVRAAIHRGMAAVRQSIEDADRLIEQGSKPDTPMAGTLKDMGRNMKAYNEQLLREMEQYIPEELR